MRLNRMAALGASMLVLSSACATGGGTTPSPAGQGSPGTSATPAASSPSGSQQGSPDGSGAAGDTIASQLVLGGPPECPERPFCLIGLMETYGLEFQEFLPLDVAGPLTVSALENGDIDVGLLLTSDPAIADRGFVLLEDDQQLQLADNIIPVMRQEILDASPEIADLINPWMALLTQEELTALNAAVNVDQEDPADAVSTWLADNGLEDGTVGEGVTVIVGSTNFYEQEILGEIFGQVLEANGYTVDRRFQLGAREVVFPALESGEIDILAEYIATVLLFVDPDAEATTDAQETADALNTALEDSGLVALDFAPATDQNGFVVTQATADEFSLTTISDLAKPAP
ncbi:MAG: glycine betaine ABC transporter substrate-binding protein [Candidatus Limnocylindrales bacterium]